MPTQERLKELLDYNPETGVFTRKTGRFKGKECTHQMPQGYYRFRVDGSLYMAHRLAWVWMTGQDPAGLSIDHKDGDKTNNKWDNLRLADEFQQGANKRRRDVHFVPKINKWMARFQHRGERLYLGVHPTEQEALKVVELKRKELLKDFA